MLSAEANERLTRVGVGTPCGELMRRYWIPIAPYAQLLEDPVRKVRVLGEDGGFDAGFKKVLKLAKRLFLGLGFRLRRRRQHPLQHIILDTLVMQSGYGLEPRMLFRCDFDRKTHGFTS